MSCIRRTDFLWEFGHCGRVSSFKVCEYCITLLTILTNGCVLLSILRLVSSIYYSKRAKHQFIGLSLFKEALFEPEVHGKVSSLRQRITGTLAIEAPLVCIRGRTCDFIYPVIASEIQFVRLVGTFMLESVSLPICLMSWLRLILFLSWPFTASWKH